MNNNNNNKINKIIFSILFACAAFHPSSSGSMETIQPEAHTSGKFSYVSADNPNSTNGTPVLFFSGFSTQGGILPDLFENIEGKMKENNPLVNNMSKFMMPQWPGISLTK